MIFYREVKKEDLKKVSKLYAQAFKEYCYLKCTVGNNFNNDDKYLHFLEMLFFINIKTYMKKHICLVGILDGKIVSSAVLKNPDRSEIGLFEYIFSGGIKLLKEISLLNILSFLNFMDDSQKAFKSIRRPIWYLEALAVDKLYQGKKLGSKMINDCVIPCVIDHGGKEIFLITNSEINRKFYTQNGFTEFSDDVIHFKNININNWSYFKKL
ncbi:GNAT family N-acetyltransferase [Clostridium felsineum]|uniref:GNAT family N-acetyltransferase n=1 Tax=Clostridium felsineum TaxID=36839 RepID=UPI0009D3C49D|nr:GNAT family N-acetyltransferase [Clostridium felsineum]URZ01914.1 hypothetical protein CLAUR_019110 [Clostridium felsineum]